MELIDNINRLLGDNLKRALKPGARLKVPARDLAADLFLAPSALSSLMRRVTAP